MGTLLTTPRQIKGFRHELNRVDEALSRQDVRGLGSPLTRLRGWLGLGGVIGILILVAAFVMSLLNPKPDGSVAAIVTTRNDGRFVQFNRRLHPVINLLEPRTDTTAVWTVCDWHDSAVPLSLLRAGDITTAVIAGRDMLHGRGDLGDHRGMLVRPSNDPAQLWLLYRDTRSHVGRDDYATQAALGLTPARIDAAITVSPSLLGAITASPALTAPKLSDRGNPSSAMAGSSIGGVLTMTTTSDSRAFYLVGRTGVQMIGSVLVQMMANTGSTQKLVDDPAPLEDLPRVSIVADNHFPSTVPTLESDPAPCWSWSKDRDELTAHTRVFTASQMPISDAGRVASVHLLPNNGSEDQATDSVMRSGFGWHARTTRNGADSVAAEQLLWIDPNGTSFPIDWSDAVGERRDSARLLGSLIAHPL